MPFSFDFGGFDPSAFGGFSGGAASQPQRPKRERKPRKAIGNAFTRTLINLGVTLLFGLGYFYFELPALNFHAEEFYVFLFLLCAVYCGCAVLTSGFQGTGARGYLGFVKKQCTVPFVLGLVLACVMAGLFGVLIGIPALRIICPHFLLAGAGIVLSSVFQALGNGVFSLTVSVCRQLVVLIPAAWLLSRTGEVNMVWWSFIIAEVVSLTLSLIFMARINRTVIVPLYEEQDAAV